jgi:hypothetical protein
MVLSLLLWKDSKTKYLNTLGAAVIILSIVHLNFVETKKLSPENITVRQAAEFIDQMPEAKGKEKLTNHTFIMFYSNSFKENTDMFKKLDLKNLSSAPKGSVIIWDSHYGYRPEFMNDVKSDILLDTVKYKMVKQFASSDDRFGAYIFVKN